MPNEIIKFLSSLNTNITFSNEDEINLINMIYKKSSILSEKNKNSQENEFDNLISHLLQDDYILKNPNLKKLCKRVSKKPNDFDEDGVMKSDPDKNRWSFYIRFKISKPLDFDLNELSISDDFLIVTGSELSLNETQTLKLINLKPMLYREILEVSKNTEQALILAFAGLGIGIAYAQSLGSEAITEYLRTSIEDVWRKNHITYEESSYTSYIHHPNDAYGINYFQFESTPIDFQAKKTCEPLNKNELEKLFTQFYQKFNILHHHHNSFKKFEIANSILTTSLFDDSLINKIILSMTAIEVLTEKEMRSKTEIDVLSELINIVQGMSLDKNVEESIRLGLESLKSQSIGKSCRNLIKKLLGKEEAKEFYDIYNFRSQLVHGGKLKNHTDADLIKIHGKAYVLAKKTLNAYLIDMEKIQIF